MARVSFIEEKDHPELADIIAKIRGNRGGRLLDFYKVMLHSPALVSSWLEQATAVRSKTDLDGPTREIVMMRVAILNRDDYVFNTHVAEYALKEGLTREQCFALADWYSSTLFNVQQRAVLAYTDAITRDIQVSDAIFNQVRQHFSERQTVELTVLVSTYNMHTRILQALQVGS